MKELVYTGIFLLLGIVLILLLLSMFSPDETKTPAPQKGIKQEALLTAPLINII